MNERINNGEDNMRNIYASRDHPLTEMTGLYPTFEEEVTDLYLF